MQRLHDPLRYFLSFLFPFLLTLFLIPIAAQAEVSVENGQKLFKQYCASCHGINNKMVGPALKGITQKRSEKWLIEWIRNNAALRAAGDKDAIAIWEEYGRNEMPQFLSLTDDDIRSILAYVEQDVPAPGAPAAGQGTAPVAADKQSPVLLYVIAVVLLAIFLTLVRANRLLRRMTAEALGEPMPEPVPWSRRIRSPKAIAFYGLVAVGLLGFTLADSAIRLGRSKNYTPEQPINFSHELHAGTLKIDCRYCHSSAEKSKVASIPSVNTCMNCHSAVQQGRTPEGTAEIQKIYAAYENNKPIQWVKIHNLPDHVYFSHAQHVTAGKIDCQTCHGPVETMKKVYQYASLSMGWCLNCHRQTEVQFQDNAYYTLFTELHEKVKSNPDMKVTAQMTGGDECQRCHY
ncbi:MAG: c-type cytochrome [Chitinophagales bacterium]|nr:c-type cytochrome [Chitinophagales bacterium]MDW8393064.1 c-type cytochrome [Chitinophagales bacterium]